MIEPTQKYLDEMLQGALQMPSPLHFKKERDHIAWIVKQRYIPPAWPIETYLGAGKWRWDWASKTLLFCGIMSVSFFITWILLK